MAITYSTSEIPPSRRRVIQIGFVWVGNAPEERVMAAHVCHLLHKGNYAVEMLTWNLDTLFFEGAVSLRTDPDSVVLVVTIVDSSEDAVRVVLNSVAARMQRHFEGEPFSKGANVQLAYFRGVHALDPTTLGRAGSHGLDVVPVSKDYETPEEFREYLLRDLSAYQPPQGLQASAAPPATPDRLMERHLLEQAVQELGTPDAARHRIDAKLADLLVTVFYGTNCSDWTGYHRGSGIQPHPYTANRGLLSCGVAHVSIPPGHRRGHLERPTLWRLEVRENVTKHVVLLRAAPRSLVDFANELDSALDESEQAPFLFVHGYNVDFSEAARRTAQLGYDLQVSAPMMFAWPSRGSVGDYIADGTTAEWSGRFLAEFLTLVLRHTTRLGLHVIAHSMGNRVLTKALQIIGGELCVHQLRQVVLTAPDIDSDVFETEIAPRLAQQGTRRTLYASSNDHALKVANTLHRSRRAGDCSEGVLICDGIDSIDASGVSTGIGHSVFAERSVVEDLSLLLRSGLSPSQRNLRAQHQGDKQYWVVPP